MDEQTPQPLQYASVGQDGDAFFVSIAHPSYNSGGAVRVTGYHDADGANAGASWWDQFVQTTPPEELVDVDGQRFPRVSA